MPRSLTNLDLDLVRSFVAIAQSGSFTRAAEAMGRQQSSISLQMQRLERQIGRSLLLRSPHRVRLTEAGEQFLVSARRLLALNDEIVARASEPEMHGLVRLGTPEDFATCHLPGVLERFAQAYPAISLAVTCDLTLNLIHQFRTGAFDLVLVKREQTIDADGIRVWREPLVWVSGQADVSLGAGPLPLVVSPEPCVYRHRAVEALEKADIPWRIAYTCGSLAGSLAAVKARLGLAVLPRGMVTDDLRVVGEGLLPPLLETEIALLEAPSISVPAQRLKQHIVRCLRGEV